MRQVPNRVLHVFRAMNCGGAETAMMTVYRAIATEEWQFDFAVLTDRAGYYDQEIVSRGGRILPHPDPVSKGLLAYYRALLRTLRAGTYAAIHSHVHHFSGVVLRAAHEVGIPVRVSHSHTVEGARGGLRRAMYRGLMKSLIRRHATHVVGVSQPAFIDLFGVNAFRPKTRGQVLANGIDLSLYIGLSQQRAEVRRELGLGDESTVVGHVGRFEAVKNHSFLIQTFAELVPRLPDVHLVLAGEGPLGDRIDDQIRQLGLDGRVHRLGIVRNVPRLLAALDLFLFPSLWEGLPLAFVEAQAAGIPCLASSGVPRESDIGVGLATFRDLEEGPPQWASASEDLLRVPRPTWSEREQALIDKACDVGHVSEQLLRIYSSGRETSVVSSQCVEDGQRVEV